jgi:hypothetical protein
MPAALAIHRLRAQTPPQAQPVAARLALQALGSDLEDALPHSLPPQALLWLRRLQLQVPAAALARPAPPAWRRDWIAAGRSQLDTALGQAARPALGPVPEDAPAVLFADTAEMLACLALAARQGQLGRWWWRGLLGRAWPDWQVAWAQRPEAQAGAERLLMRALAQGGAGLPPAAGQPFLAPDLASGPAQAAGLPEPEAARPAPSRSGRAAAAGDVALPELPPGRPATDSTLPASPPGEGVQASSGTPFRAVPFVTPAQPGRAASPAQASSRAAPVDLPAPPANEAPAAAASPARCRPQVIGPTAPAGHASRRHQAPPPLAEPAQAARPAPGEPPAAMPEPVHTTAAPPAPQVPVAHHALGQPTPPAHTPPAGLPTPRLPAPAAQAAPEPAAPEPAAPPAWPWPEAVLSTQAPLLFLVNALLEDGLYPDFTRPRDPGLPVPLWALLAELAACWRVAPLPATLTARALPWQLPAALPAAPGAAAGPWSQWLPAYARALRRRLCRRLGLRASQWPQALTLPRPARLWLSEAEVVAEFDLAGHDLAWRLAGLDRDPGWLPAAGCSLRFRFA